MSGSSRKTGKSGAWTEETLPAEEASGEEGAAGKATGEVSGEVAGAIGAGGAGAPADLRERAGTVYGLLAEEYPEARCALEHRDAYELTVATILSAQCTDERVNMVTPELFRRFPDVESLAGARQEELEELIRSTGFYRNKARNLIAMAEAVVREHGGRIPRSLAELVALPGVGRKTANVILGNAFGIDEGVVVDTHVKRLSNRLGFTREKSPEAIERDLMALFPRGRWTMLAHLLIFHGRAVCKARKPQCEDCVVARLCPSSRV